MTTPSKRCRGFTAVEVLVALAIVAVLTAIVVPQIAGRITESRQSALSQTFFGLSQGIAEYKKAVTRYPYQLSLLTQKPVLSAPNAKDVCGDTLIASHINNWRGPYVSRQLLSGGIPMGDGLIHNQLRKEPTPGSPQYLLIDAANIDTKIAERLEAELDGVLNTNAATGTIRYTTAAVGALSPVPPGTDMVNLSYSIPIGGC